MEVPRPPIPAAVEQARKKKAKLRLWFIGISIIILGGAYWYIEKSFSLPFQQIVSFEYAATSKIENNFSAPPPLQQLPNVAAKSVNTLTLIGVVERTNSQRAANGNLPSLTENATLDDIAMLRLDDMFEKQYFAHVAPDGSSAQTVASTVGYSYLALGENLALGNFAGDAGVVTAWMNSPGHRANILDTHYSQIGVAVREGTFNHQTTWIAVQIFGKPTSDCPSADESLKASIDAAEAQISSDEAQLEQSKSDIQAMDPQSGPEYNQKVVEYNASVQQYNDLVAQTKATIVHYDAEVQAFNACLGV